MPLTKPSHPTAVDRGCQVLVEESTILTTLYFVLMVTDQADQDTVVQRRLSKVSFIMVYISDACSIILLIHVKYINGDR